MSDAHRGFGRTLLWVVVETVFLVLVGLLLGYVIWGVKL